MTKGVLEAIGLEGPRVEYHEPMYRTHSLHLAWVKK